MAGMSSAWTFVRGALFALVLGALIFGGVVTQAEAENPHDGPVLGYLSMFYRLSLTQDQLTLFQSLLTSQETVLSEERSAIKTAREDLLTYLKTGGSDAAEVQSLVSAITTAQGDLETEQANIFISAYSLLTDEQRQQLAELSDTPGGATQQSLTEEQLIAMRDNIAAATGQTPEGLNQIIENFATADTNGDALLSMEEYKAYAEANDLEMPPAPPQDRSSSGRGAKMGAPLPPLGSMGL